MRLTAELIQSSRAHYNTLRDRELDLRGARARATFARAPLAMARLTATGARGRALRMRRLQAGAHREPGRHQGSRALRGGAARCWAAPRGLRPRPASAACWTGLTDPRRAPQDQFDTIDFTDNEIRKLENFPVMRRLRTLLLNNNHVSRIAANLGDQLVALDTLVLTNNLLSHFADVDALASLKRLDIQTRRRGARAEPPCRVCRRVLDSSLAFGLRRLVAAAASRRLHRRCPCWTTPSPGSSTTGCTSSTACRSSRRWTSGRSGGRRVGAAARGPACPARSHAITRVHRPAATSSRRAGAGSRGGAVRQPRGQGVRAGSGCREAHVCARGDRGRLRDVDSRAEGGHQGG